MTWDEARKARKRLSTEQGAISKDWGGRLPVALIYPSSYHVGMSSLGIHALYSLLNNYTDVVCERAFWEKENQSSNQFALSLESQRPLTDFAVIAFSISYELDYFHAAQMLKASGIPLYASERNESHPLIIAGGPCITANPMPVAPFFDCLCIGEAEAIVPAILPILTENIASERKLLLQKLGKIPGIYVPLYHTEGRVTRQWAQNLDDFSVHTVVFTWDTELGDLFLMEVERGCNWRCRFCLTSTAFCPMRHRSIDKLLSQAQWGLKYRKRIGLVGPDLSSYPHIEELTAELRQMGAELSASSLRIRPLPALLVGELAKGGARTITLAPEAGSQRLRQVIKKGITEEDIFRSVEKVAEERIKQLKLYFMIGLPTETDEDIEEMIKVALKCKGLLDKQRAGCRITLNVAPFVPKAGTPFQWSPMAPLPTLDKRLSMLRNHLTPKGIKLKSESTAWSQVQAVLARGDTELAKVIAGVDRLSLSGLRQEMAKHNLDIDTYAHREWNRKQKLPWSVIDLGIKPEMLEQEFNQAMSQRSE